MACAPVISGQDAFRVDVGLVNVSFTVRDSRGALVTDLRAEDFEVYEDSVPQRVAFFARSEEVPLRLGLAVDFSGSQEKFLKLHRRDLEAFLKEVLREGDQVFLVGFGNHIRLLSDFSGAPHAVLDALREYENGERGFPRLGPPETRVLGTAFYDAIYYSIDERLAHEERSRRALILFSDGEDNSSANHMLDAIEAAQMEDVRLYCLRYTEAKEGRLNARNKYGIRVMERLASETGGMHLDATQGGLRDHFLRISEELRSSYELAYHSSNPARDGTYRKIRIVPRLGGMTVRAKSGYFAR